LLVELNLCWHLGKLLFSLLMAKYSWFRSVIDNLMIYNFLIYSWPISLLYEIEGRLEILYCQVTLIGAYRSLLFDTLYALLRANESLVLDFWETLTRLLILWFVRVFAHLISNTLMIYNFLIFRITPDKFAWKLYLNAGNFF
jgi:hypothetical protein